AEVAKKQYEQAMANLKLLKAGAWQYDKEIAAAAVKVAQAQVQQTQTDLDRCLVRAPTDGVGLQVNVRPGENVGTPPSHAPLARAPTAGGPSRRRPSGAQGRGRAPGPPPGAARRFPTRSSSCGSSRT